MSAKTSRMRIGMPDYSAMSSFDVEWKRSHATAIATVASDQPNAPPGFPRNARTAATSAVTKGKAMIMRMAFRRIVRGGGSVHGIGRARELAYCRHRSVLDELLVRCDMNYAI